MRNGAHLMDLSLAMARTVLKIESSLAGSVSDLPLQGVRWDDSIGGGGLSSDLRGSPDSPVFRVSFYEMAEPGESQEDEGRGFDLACEDVWFALRWAEDKRREDEFYSVTVLIHGYVHSAWVREWVVAQSLAQPPPVASGCLSFRVAGPLPGWMEPRRFIEFMRSVDLPTRARVDDAGRLGVGSHGSIDLSPTPDPGSVGVLDFGSSAGFDVEAAFEASGPGIPPLSVGPADSASLHDDLQEWWPTYRVAFENSGIDDAHSLGSSFDLRGVDLSNVVQWAARNCGPRELISVEIVVDGAVPVAGLAAHVRDLDLVGFGYPSHMPLGRVRIPVGGPANRSWWDSHARMGAGG